MKKGLIKKYVILGVLSLLILCQLCIPTMASSLRNNAVPGRKVITPTKSESASFSIKMNEKTVQNGATITVSEGENLRIQIAYNNSGYGISSAKYTLDGSTEIDLKRVNNAVSDEIVLPENLEEGNHSFKIKIVTGQLYFNPIERPVENSVMAANTSTITSSDQGVTGETIFTFTLVKQALQVTQIPMIERVVTKTPSRVISLIPKITTSLTLVTPTPTPIKTTIIIKTPTPTKVISEIKTPTVVKKPVITETIQMKTPTITPALTPIKAISRPADIIPVEPIVPPVTAEEITPTVVVSYRDTKEDSFAVSDWAKEEVKQASEDKLIPVSIGDNFKKEVTRKEFAAIALRFYEAYTGKNVTIPKENPFKDTKDQEILKAYAIGITNGTSQTEFSPEQRITREQMATMMTRALKAAGVNVSRSSSSSNTLFADHSNISDYALDSVYFMSEKNIIKGIGENVFDSKGEATIEQSLLISERMYQVFKD